MDGTSSVPLVLYNSDLWLHNGRHSSYAFFMKKARLIIGNAETMEISRFSFSPPPFGEPLGTVFKINKRGKYKIDFSVKFTEDDWKTLAKATARIFKIHVSSKMPQDTGSRRPRCGTAWTFQ